MSGRVRVLAPAKVNLTLEVLGRRADGYHDLASVMATIDLHDDVRVGVAPTLDIRIRPDVGAPPGDDLASRAVRAMARSCGRPAVAHVNVRKRIPVAAGLGGGSSDAGAVIRALAALWSCGADVAAPAAAIGSDVPFFAAGHALARLAGRGERLAPLPLPSVALWIALVTLPARAPTREVFAAVEPREMSTGRATGELSRAFVDGTIGPGALREIAHNDLEAAAIRVCPLVAEAIEAARGLGVRLVVSGSGPSLFAIADDRADAIRVSRRLRRTGLRARARRVGMVAPLTRT